MACLCYKVDIRSHKVNVDVKFPRVLPEDALCTLMYCVLCLVYFIYLCHGGFTHGAAVTDPPQ